MLDDDARPVGVRGEPHDDLGGMLDVGARVEVEDQAPGGSQTDDPPELDLVTVGRPLPERDRLRAPDLAAGVVGVPQRSGATNPRRVR